MTTNLIYLAETALFEGGALAWAAWELWKLRPRKDGQPEAPSAFARRRRGPAAPESGSPEPASPEPAGHPEREHGPDHG